jgi:hypothetical protein
VSKPHASPKNLRMLAAKVGERERGVVALIEALGPVGVLAMLDALHAARDACPTAPFLMDLAELGLLHALRLHLDSPQKVPAPSSN